MSQEQHEGIAIIGMAGRFPGAASVEELWANLLAGTESISFFSDADLAGSGLDGPALRARGSYVAARGVLDDVEGFDAAFFGIHPREAEVMDPQHRLFLEQCWVALEGAGHAPSRMAGAVGVFGGVSFNTYYEHVLRQRPELRDLVGPEMVMFGNEKDYLTTRVAYKLGLTGPAVNVSTACSTSLVAVCLACDALLAYQCDTALAGGASITVPQARGYFYDEGNIGSCDGHTRSFDAQSAGTVFSNGAGVVVLKRLEDAVRDRDRIYAVIKGTGVNNDGSQRVSFGAPGVQGQSDAIAMAHAMAGFDPATIGYVEAHGTATPLGDPIELAGLTRAFRLGTGERQFCAIGSLKTNIGHLDVASGVAGLIKTVLALHHRVIPASLHFEQPNPKLQLEESPFHVSATRRDWHTAPGAPRRAGVSSFGTGGTNAHVVLEQAPDLPASGASRPAQLLLLSARTAEALERATDNLAARLRHLANPGDGHVDAAPAAALLADSAFTLQTGRSRFDHRRSLVCADFADGAAALGGRDPRRVVTHVSRAAQQPVVFMFPGQGAQYAGMGAGLYRTEPVFRASVDRCVEVLHPLLGLDLRTVMFAEGDGADDAEGLLGQTRLTQPALFVLEYALATLWMSWGIEPAAMIGHSVGEYVAGCLAGVFPLDVALMLVARRGALVQALPGGAMLAVRLSEHEVMPLLDGDLAIAAVNAPRLCVVSGPNAAIGALEARLLTQGTGARRLRTSHAFHSPMMAPVLAPFTALLREVALGAPRIPFVSNVTARWITDAEATSPDYWAGHVRQAVRFADGVQELMPDGGRVLLEVGPGQTLATLARQHPAVPAGAIVLSSLPSRDRELDGLLGALGTLWATGSNVDWDGFYANERRSRVALPTYPFERTRCWPAADVAPASDARPGADCRGGCSPDAPSVSADAASRISVVGAATRLHRAAGSAQGRFSPASVPAAPAPAADCQGQHGASGGDPMPLEVVEEPFVDRRPRLLGRVRALLQELSGMPLRQADPAAPFVVLGLDSLLLTQVGSALRSEFGVRISFRQLMEELSCMDAIAAHLDGVLPADQAPAPAAPRVRVIEQAQPAAMTTIETLLAQQQELTSQVLALLRQQAGGAASVPDAPSAARGGGPAAPAPPVARPAGTPRSTPAALPSSPVQAIERSAPGSLTVPQQTFLDPLVARYTARTAKSKLHTQASRVPLADPRTMAGFRACWKEMVYPLVIERSSGSRMWDLDGNEYVDFTMGFGTNLLGHSPPFVTAAIEAQLRKGIEVGPQTPLAGEVAALMCELTGMERCAFANTGSEAVLAAIRVARTVTGRTRIVYFTGDYHGLFDEVLQRASSGGSGSRPMPAAPGIPPQPPGHLMILEYNRAESLDAIRAAGAEIAAVIVEPVQSRAPDLQPRAFLQQLREVTREIGAALVFDEVITGFRAHPGGVQALFGVRADMATYGKVIGGGMPIGALCGSAAYLDALDGGFWQYGDSSIPESGVTFFAGTYVRHPLAIASARATLAHLKREGPGLQHSLNVRMGALVQELNDFLAGTGAPLRVESFSSLFWLRLDPASTYGGLLFFLLRDKGIHIFEGRLFFLSTAHSEADLQHLLRAFKESVHEMQAAGFLAGGAIEAPRPVPLTARADPGVYHAPAAPKTVLAPQPRVTAAHPTVARPAMKFGVYFFGSYDAPFAPDKYQLLLDTAGFADRHGFSAVWIPERHFHPVGGFSPNPAVTAAALATITRNIHLRAGSVVLPLHNPMRVAEEWSVVDNLSKGRVGLSIASGWHPNDFVLAPGAYDTRRELCSEGMETIRRLWSGGSIAARGGTGQEVNVSLHPMPMQRELPLWLTCVHAGSFEKAGELGVGVLAMLTNQTLDEVAGKIAIYRRARAAHGHDPATGNVTILVHTFVGADFETAVATARGPMREYLRSYLDNSRKRHDNQPLADEDLEYLLDRSFDDYLDGKALIGTPETCALTVARLHDLGVDELGCFLDFGVDARSVRESLPLLHQLQQRCQEIPPGKEAAPGVGLEPATGLARGLVTLPLSESQQGLALLARLTPAGNRAYTEMVTLRLRGPLEVDVLGRALALLVQRHEGLRTTIDPGGETQTVHAAAAPEIALVDLSLMPEIERRAQLASALAEVEAAPFDFSCAPLLQARLLRLAVHEHLLVFTFHHIVGNGPSYEVLFGELSDCYGAMVVGVAPQLEPAMQLGEYVRWRETQLTGPDFAADRTFWRRQFAEGLPVLDLPTDLPRPPAMTYRGGRASLTVGAPLAAGLRKVGGSLNASAFTVLFAAFNVLLHRLSGAAEIVVGVPFEGEVRTRPAGSRLFANTTNMVPLRSSIQPGTRFADFLAATRSLVLDAGEHQAYFFGRLLQDLQVRPDLSRPPMFAASFNLERGTFHRTSGALDIGLVVDDVPFGNPRGASKFELALNIVDNGSELRLDCDYSSDLFTPATVQRWLGHYQTLIEGIVADPAATVGGLPILTETERRQLLVDWNQTGVAYDGPATLHGLFEQQVDRTPQGTAVTYEGASLTYRELDDRANRLAHYLSAQGVGPDRLVGICAERSLELVIGLLGILKAGGAYVPIDPSYPRERVAFMLEDAGVDVLLTQAHLVAGLPPHSARTICLDTGWPALDAESDGRRGGPVGPDNLAYMIYTSGSTGVPKGALNTHGAIVNRLRWMQDEYHLTVRDAVLQKTPFSFDVSVWEFFWPLMAGARLVVARPAGHQAPDYLVQVINRERITIVHFVPSMLRVFLETTGLTSCVSLRDVICSGEALPGDLVDAFHAALPATLHNLYGPTEAAVDVTAWRCRRDERRSNVPIGRPVANTRCYILDAALNPVPIGSPMGELHLGGVQVGRGYHGRPALTAERFIPDPFAGQPGARLYKTGDLCRYLSDGTIEYLGRMDHQVKIRGFRIELGEIEAVLARHHTVKQCVVVARDRAPGDQWLVAYVESASPLAAVVDDWRAHLKAALPDFMIPSAFVAMAAMPLSPNGKVDRQALPAPSDRPRAAATVAAAPPTRTALRLAAIWKDLLGVARVEPEDDFFRLGGHSLLAMRLVNRVYEEFGVALPAGALFEFPILADLAQRIAPAPSAIVAAQAAPGAAAAPTPAPPAPEISWEDKVLVRMETGGSGTPFFWVHGVGGEVYNCMQVSKHLAGARPVYGFAADWTRIAAAAPVTLDAIAGHYVKVMRAAQATGPYHLGGLCAGAKLALEIARQLERVGGRVGVLAAIDCGIGPALDAPSGVRALFAFLRNAPRWLRDDAMPSGTRDLFGRLRSRFRRARAGRFRGLPPAGNGRGPVDLRDQLGMWRFPDHQVEMLQLHHHTIESFDSLPMAGKATVFLPRASPLFGPWPKAHDVAWDRLATGGVDVCRVPGSHSTMMSDPFAREVADRLNQAITAVELG